MYLHNAKFVSILEKQQINGEPSFSFQHQIFNFQKEIILCFLFC